MGFEYKSSEIPPKQPEALDEKWYGQFKNIANFDSVNYLSPTKKNRDEQEEKFLKGDIDSPEFNYADLEKIDFQQKEKALLSLKKEIIEKELDETIKQIYHWKLNEKIAELRMLRAASAGNDRKFYRYSNFIYGKPEKEIYEYSISQLRKIVDEQLFSDNPEIRKSAQKLNKELFEALMGNESQINPKDYPFKKKEFLENEKEYSTEEIKQAFDEAIKEYAFNGWEVFIDEGGKYKSVTVIQEEKKIAIPEKRTEKETGLKALIAHEIGTHVIRREKGERSKLKLLGLGLDRYTKGEEGVATYNQQQIRGTEDFSGLDYHLAISLAVGLDGKKRNFREVFDLLKEFYFIRSKKADKKEAFELAGKYAWTDCVRIFRGTTGKMPGLCFTKDIAYREGNIAVWDLVKNNSKEVKRFSVGKYDPGNPRHIWILEQLGIEDEDLEAIEK